MFVLFVASMLSGQRCGPSGCFSTPSSTYVFASAQSAPPWGPRESRTYRWMTGVVAGQPREVWGWEHAGIMYFLASDQAQARAERRRNEQPIEPAPVANIESPSILPAFETNGVDRSKLGGQKYQIVGQNAQRFVSQLTRGQSIDDDSKKPFLTVIGTEAECKPVMDAINGTGELAMLAKNFHVHEYRPNNPHVTGIGLPNQGKPTIIVQTSTGYIPHLQYDYTGKEATLAKAINRSGVLRAPNPSFDENKTIDLRHDPKVRTVFWFVILVILGIVLIVPHMGQTRK